MTEKNDAVFLEYNESTKYDIREIKPEDEVELEYGALDEMLQRNFFLKSSRPVDENPSNRQPFLTHTYCDGYRRGY